MPAEIEKQAIARRLREIMRKQGVSQAELAKRMKVSRTRVSRILSGKENLSLDTIATVAFHLGHKVLPRFQRKPEPIEWTPDFVAECERLGLPLAA